MLCYIILYLYYIIYPFFIAFNHPGVSSTLRRPGEVDHFLIGASRRRILSDTTNIIRSSNAISRLYPYIYIHIINCWTWESNHQISMSWGSVFTEKNACSTFHLGLRSWCQEAAKADPVVQECDEAHPGVIGGSNEYDGHVQYSNRLIWCYRMIMAINCDANQVFWLWASSMFWGKSYILWCMCA